MKGLRYILKNSLCVTLVKELHDISEHQFKLPNQFINSPCFHIKLIINLWRVDTFLLSTLYHGSLSWWCLSLLYPETLHFILDLQTSYINTLTLYFYVQQSWEASIVGLPQITWITKDPPKFQAFQPKKGVNLPLYPLKLLLLPKKLSFPILFVLFRFLLTTKLFWAICFLFSTTANTPHLLSPSTRVSKSVFNPSNHKMRTLQWSM